MGKRQKFFTKDSSQMANKYMKRYLILLTIRGKQIKPQWDRQTIVRMAKIKNSATPNAGEDADKKCSLILHWWENKIVQPLCKTDWQFLIKLNMHLPFYTATTLLGI